jgi:hypothetical protein
MGTVRRATERDADAIGDIAEAKRAQYARYQPVFWRPHPEGRASHVRYVRRTMNTRFVFVHEEDGAVDAYGVGELFPVPAVFGAADRVCVVDGFATRRLDLWATAGAAVLDALLGAAADAGAASVAVVSGRDDEPKCSMLERAGLGPDSGWHVRERDRAPATSPDVRVRPAEPRDAAAVLELAAARRAPHERYQPTFWQRAGAVRDEQIAALSATVADSGTVALVHETTGRIDGYAVGTLETAPPVYNPGGPVLLVGDFAADRTDEAVGAALLEAVGRCGHERGAVLTAVVAGHADEGRRRLLADRGFRQASQWYVRPLRGA